MRLVLLLVAAIGLVSSRPQDYKSNFQLANPIYITKYIYDLLPDQSYFYSYEQNDEQKKFERGYIRPGPTPEEDINTVEGSYSYVGPDGQNYNVTYTADENGFQPSGDHIPMSAGVKPKLGISSAALASLSG